MNQIPKVGDIVKGTNKQANSSSGGNITFGGIKDVGIMLLLIALAMTSGGSGFSGAGGNITSRITNTNDIVRDRDNFVGKSVTIRSKPVQRISLRSFAVRDNRFFGGNPIIVINASGASFELPEDQNIEVQVTGQVRNLDIKKIENDFKLNIQDESYQDYIGQPVIVARDIALAPLPAQITTSPEQFYGRRVAMMGKVKDIQNPISLKLDKNNLLGGQDLLVLFKRTPRVAINKGQTVAVMGEVRPFVRADIERDYKMNLNSINELESKYTNKPVLIADAVYP
jgi:hypothetical protein